MAEPGMISLPPAEERGRDSDGKTVGMDRRLYMQLLGYRGEVEEARLLNELEGSGMEYVLYRDLYDPAGYGLLTMSEDPAFFVGTLRTFLRSSAFGGMEHNPRYGMFGRSYAMGHEANLADVLLRRPRERAANPDWPWAIWYPLRRRGSFQALSEGEQRSILAEHGRLGAAFGREGYGVDIRLSCYGLDGDDNDFLLGLVGPSLHRLSLIVETMRKTRHTSEFLERLGPFFVGWVAGRRCTL